MISLSPSEFSNSTCLSCDAASVNGTFDYTNRSVIERSIGFDYQSFGNRTFDCVRLAKFYCEFDYVRLSSAIERLVFDWVRLPNCSIGKVGIKYCKYIDETCRPRPDRFMENFSSKQIFPLAAILLPQATK